MKHYTYGDYVITAIPNAFNSKTGYWISKKNYTVSVYGFSATTEREAQEQLKHADGYLKMFDRFLERLK